MARGMGVQAPNGTVVIAPIEVFISAILEAIPIAQQVTILQRVKNMVDSKAVLYRPDGKRVNVARMGGS